MSVGSHPPRQTGVVVIGRNEGERLRRCLQSLRGQSARVIYVDSGSSDDSLQTAAASGAGIVPLDMRAPFTAARARNEGFRRLLKELPAVEYVFFVDGDCEVVGGWLERAAGFLDEHPETAIVWGMRRERFPESSVYNLLCDIEWRDYPTGDVKFCGGDALIRTQAFRQVDGYRDNLICGEEPEMCVRLRQAGWRIFHSTDAMTLHDAAIFRFGQWWRRMVRGGYGFAQGMALHGDPPERFGVTESGRALLWGLGIPALVAACALVGGRWALLALLIYPLQIARLGLAGKRSARENWWRAVALVVSKFPEMIGQFKFLIDRLRRKQPALIEYK